MPTLSKFWRTISSLSLGLAASVALAQQVRADDVEESTHAFASHLARGAAVEPQVFIEISPGSAIVRRPSAADAAAQPDAQLFGRATNIPLNGSTNPSTQTFNKGLAVGQTLNQWLASSGTAQVDCFSGGAVVELSFNGLKANGLYTLWQVAPNAMAIPLGGDGTLNSFRADDEGEGETAIVLGYCPSAIAATVTTAVGLHFDDQSHGDTPGGPGVPGGIVFAIQMLADLNR
jgi:hypothetical protein